MTQSSDDYELIQAVIDFVNRMLNAYYKPTELPVEALRSYYVDYYLSEYLNGGLSQFVYNSKWNSEVVAYVRDGLAEMGATHHVALFDRLGASVAALGTKLPAYFESCGSLLPLDPQSYETHMQTLCEAVPALESRAQEALDSESPEDKAIRRLCAAAGHTLIRFNGWDQSTYQGQPVGRFHITTSEGHHYVIFVQERALLFNGTTHTLVTSGAA